jgi:hypothetical protein
MHKATCPIVSPDMEFWRSDCTWKFNCSGDQRTPHFHFLLTIMAALPISVELMSKPIHYFLHQPCNKSLPRITLAYSTDQLKTLVHPVLTGISHIVSVLLHEQTILHIHNSYKHNSLIHVVPSTPLHTYNSSTTNPKPEPLGYQFKQHKINFTYTSFR